MQVKGRAAGKYSTFTISNVEALVQLEIDYAAICKDDWAKFGEHSVGCSGRGFRPSRCEDEILV